MVYSWTTVTYLDDSGYISGWVLLIWTRCVTYLDDCHMPWRLKIYTSHVAIFTRPALWNSRLFWMGGMISVTKILNSFMGWYIAWIHYYRLNRFKLRFQGLYCSTQSTNSQMQCKHRHNKVQLQNSETWIWWYCYHQGLFYDIPWLG